MSAELAQMKSLLMSLPGTGSVGAPNPPTAELLPDEDIVLVAASAALFNEYNEERPSHASEPGSHSSANSSSVGA